MQTGSAKPIQLNTTQCCQTAPRLPIICRQCRSNCCSDHPANWLVIVTKGKKHNLGQPHCVLAVSLTQLKQACSTVYSHAAMPSLHAKCVTVDAIILSQISDTPTMHCSPRAGATLSAFLEGVWDGKTLPFTMLLPKCITCIGSGTPLNLNEPTCHTSICSCSR